MNVFCKQSRNNKRSLSVMMGENSGQKPLLSWEQRPFVSAIRNLIPLGPQVPTEANKCVHNSPCEEVGWARAGQTWVPVLALCLLTERLLDPSGPSSSHLSNGGAALSLPGWPWRVEETVPGKAPGPQQQGEPRVKGRGLAGSSLCCSGPPPLCSLPLAPPFPRGVVCNQHMTNGDSVYCGFWCLFFYLLKTFPGLWEDRLEPSGRRDSGGCRSRDEEADGAPEVSVPAHLVPQILVCMGRREEMGHVPSAWNALPPLLHLANSYSSFKTQLKQRLFREAFRDSPGC